VGWVLRHLGWKTKWKRVNGLVAKRQIKTLDRATRINTEDTDRSFGVGVCSEVHRSVNGGGGLRTVIIRL